MNITLSAASLGGDSAEATVEGVRPVALTVFDLHVLGLWGLEGLSATHRQN